MEPVVQTSWALAALGEFHSAEASRPAFPTPVSATSSAVRFHKELHDTFGILVLLSDSSTFADNAALIFHKFVSGEKLPSGFDPLKPLSDQPGTFVRRLQSLLLLGLEMVLSRVVDNLATYLTEVIRECLAARPELLRSNETVRVDFVLSHDDLEELRGALVDRKVNELAYLGFDNLCQWIEDRLGIGQVNQFPSRAVLAEGIEARHCVVHNRGLVTAKYIRAVPDSHYRVGDHLEFSVDSLYLTARAAVEFALQIDVALSEKFGLLRTNLSAAEAARNAGQSKADSDSI